MGAVAADLDDPVLIDAVGDSRIVILRGAFPRDEMIKLSWATASDEGTPIESFRLRTSRSSKFQLRKEPSFTCLS